MSAKDVQVLSRLSARYVSPMSQPAHSFSPGPRRRTRLSSLSLKTRGMKSAGGYKSSTLPSSSYEAMTLSVWDFTLEQLVPLSRNVLPVISFGKAGGPVPLSDQPLAIVVELLETAHCIVHIDKGTAHTKLVSPEVMHPDGFSVPLQQFTIGRIIRGHRHDPGRGGLQGR